MIIDRIEEGLAVSLVEDKERRDNVVAEDETASLGEKIMKETSTAINISK